MSEPLGPCLVQSLGSAGEVMREERFEGPDGLLEGAAGIGGVE